MRTKLQPAKGYTLIEMIIVIVVIGIMGAALAPVALSSLRAYNAIQDDVVALDKLRYATERLAREIREVKYSGNAFAFGAKGLGSMTFTRTYETPSGPSGDYTVTIGTTTVLASCITPPSAPPCVTLTYSSPVNPGEQVLMDELGEVGNLQFRFYEQDGTTETSDNSLVRYVGIDLIMMHNGHNYPQHTRVELKNYPGQ